mmetsp:Transcript_34237/g.78052  ORF Transcript_34237/g.78052 Transcript_34237/m.78052 type:complete len:184 (+) Transcript_34237:122-673(+)
MMMLLQGGSGLSACAEALCLTVGGPCLALFLVVGFLSRSVRAKDSDTKSVEAVRAESQRVKSHRCAVTQRQLRSPVLQQPWEPGQYLSSHATTASTRLSSASTFVLSLNEQNLARLAGETHQRESKMREAPERWSRAEGCSPRLSDLSTCVHVNGTAGRRRTQTSTRLEGCMESGVGTTEFHH